MNPRHTWAVAQADLRERMRRPSVYMTMGVAAFLCYLTIIGQAEVSFEATHGVWNSAWSAGTLAVIGTCYLTLVCFFVVRNGVQRDEETGVGKLIATSAVSDFSYLLGKGLSNFVVLLAIAGVFLASAPLLQWHHQAGYAFRVWEFVTPFLYLVVPAAAFIAGLAVLFECHPWLKRGVGNVLYVMLWIGMVIESAMDHRGWTDMLGFHSFITSNHEAGVAQGANVPENSLNIGHSGIDHWTTYLWSGFQFDWHTLMLRAEWLVVGAALVLAAVYFFKRFDLDARAALRLSIAGLFPRKKQPAVQGKWDTELLRLTSLDGRAVRGRFLAVAWAELTLLLKSIPKTVYVILALANLIALSAPGQENIAGGVLAFLWIVPVVVWSNMGAREQGRYARPLIFSAPHSFLRQLPAEWLAGFVIALAVSSGAGLRMLVHGDMRHVAVWLSGAAFISSLAIACGTWSRGTRLFQGLYSGWWYLALNNAPGMDFIGVTGQRHAIGFTVTAAMLFGSAMAQRWWNTERAAAMRALGMFRTRRPSEKAVA